MPRTKSSVPLLLLLLVLLVGASVGVQGTTYGSVEDLPEPDAVVTDRSSDAEAFGSGPAARWVDIKEVRAYLTEDGVAFAVFCGATIPSDEVLLVLVDVDGGGGGVGRGLLNRQKCRDAGYDFAIGYLDGLGLYTIGASWNWPSAGRLASWRKGSVAYFEATWDALGGRPDSIAFLTVAEGGGTQDQAPNHGAGQLEVGSDPCAGVPLTLVFEDAFGAALRPEWRWVRESPARWSLTAKPGYLTIVTQPGGLFGDTNDARNLLLLDAPDGDFEVSTYVEFTPTENFQFAGLIVYGSDDRFLALGRAFCGMGGPACVGNGIYFDYEAGDGVPRDNFAQDLGWGSAHLRIARRGTTYSGYYSEDGEDWELLGSHTVAALTSSEIGLYAADCGAEVGAIPAEFDFFRVEVRDCNE
jgi:hypothetical protein